jgi:hypothetical protein
MSQYLNLYIKNDKVDGFTFLTDHSGSGLDVIYEALEDTVASFTIIQPITREDLQSGIQYIKDEINNNSELIDTYKRTIKSLNAQAGDINELSDKIFEFEHSIINLENDNNSLVKAITTLETYQRIADGGFDSETKLYGGVECYPPKKEELQQDDIRDEIKIALYNDKEQKKEEALQ